MAGRQAMSVTAAVRLANPHSWVAAVYPAVFGELYCLLAGYDLSWLQAVLLLGACILMQSSVNTLNDYFDFVKGTDTTDDFVEVHDAVLVYEDIAPKQALYLGFAYLAAAALLALPVIAGAGPAPWCIGLVGGLVVLAYSGGKTPLSYLPVGELVSGGVMGGLIPLGVAAAVHGIVDGLALILAIPFIIGIGLVMMTNNISDIEKDRQARRKTLPVVVGRPTAVRLYRAAVVCWMASLIVIPLWYGGFSGLIVPALAALTGRKVFVFLLTSPMIPQERVRQMKSIAMANVLGNGAYLIGAALAVLAGRTV